jgi:hypothetical protein
MDQDQPIPARLRAQLMALGIPAAKHHGHDLAEFFPREFNIGATQMSSEEIAKVLVHFVERKLISIPGTAMPTSVREVVPGWHFCQFYRDNKQLLELVAPYVAAGLRNNEACFWVMPKAVTPEAARLALSEHVQDVDGYLASGQLEMMSHPDWYLDASGQLKTFEQIAEGLLAKQDAALARGFKFLRAAGDTGWVSGTEESKEFIDYEMKINAAIGATKVAAVCTYRADVTADEFIAIVTAHQDALSNASCC